MNTARKLLLAFAAVGCCPSVGMAETILFESATLGQTGIPISELTNQNVPGTNVTPGAFAGVRFRLDQPVITSQIGGHFVANSGGTFFGAIVELEDESDFPDSGDFTTDDFLGSASLSFPTPSDEVFGNLELSLGPGWYALVFGSGLFDTLGSGVAVRNGTDIQDPTYITGSPNTPGIWSDITAISPNHHFVIKGIAVPEPSTVVICVIGLTYLMVRRWA